MSPLLQVNNLEKEYGGKIIFSGLSFSIFEKQKIGVIGRNGAGKSTLFKIILGKETADKGEIIIGRETIIGSIEQESDFLPQELAIDYLKRKSGQEDWQCQKIASQFRFDSEQLNKTAAELSGGWQMRLKLSAMLLLEPTLFLLDEPTNYLDLGTILLLEDFLKSYRGAFLIISHDREFLKNTCTETIEITSHRCISFPQGIEAYLAFKEQRLTSDQNLNKKIDREQKHLQKFVDRFRYKDSKAKQAQAFIKKIDRMEIHKISIEHNSSSVRITMPLVEKLKKTILNVDNLSIGYNGKSIVSDLDFIVKGGERIIVVGDNGQGKTTLLRTLTEEIMPISGGFSWFTGLKKGYYGQQSTLILNQDEQVGEYLRRLASSDLKTEKVLQMAGDFLFRDEDLKKSLGVLSGGEKSRLVLAGLLLSKPDILILDEPSNHLDFETVESLGSALQDYNGVLLFTSHDRTFANLVATGIIEVNNGKSKRYYHGYEDYINQLEKRLAISSLLKDFVQTDKPKPIYHENKERQKKLKSLENKLLKLQAERAAIFQHFTDNPINYDNKKIAELEDIKQKIEEAEASWLELAE
ncbi:MAG: ABC-F family ATP-binding cassette domain-containing protein [Candidatus Falkowbacteria bacterium]